MRIYFSGEGGTSDPEDLIPELRPHLMLTFVNLYRQHKRTKERLKNHLQQRRAWVGGRK